MIWLAKLAIPVWATTLGQNNQISRKTNLEKFAVFTNDAVFHHHHFKPSSSSQKLCYCSSTRHHMRYKHYRNRHRKKADGTADRTWQMHRECAFHHAAPQKNSLNTSTTFVSITHEKIKEKELAPLPGWGRVCSPSPKTNCRAHFWPRRHLMTLVLAFGKDVEQVLHIAESTDVLVEFERRVAVFNLSESDRLSPA